LIDYIVYDFTRTRVGFNDHTIGAMVICDSAEQARSLSHIFEKKYGVLQTENLVAETLSPEEEYRTSTDKPKHQLSAALILHDEGSKADRKDLISEFKNGKIDILFVYNMLLTGFDAPRLKKIYLNRVVRKHNLLQALTRVNRTYKDFNYGYVVDFADITDEFEATNRAYFDELNSELGDEMEHYSNLFKSEEEIKSEIETIRDVLFRFDVENAEIFSQQISAIQDRSEVLAIKKALTNARELYNLIRFSGRYKLLDMIDFQKLNQLYHETINHLNLLNLKENIEGEGEMENLVNLALEDVLFMFKKISQEELILADRLKDVLRKTREAMRQNFDQKDPLFISLREELERLFKTKKLNEVTQEEMQMNIGDLRKIYERVKELNRKNEQLKAKYHHDPKYTRVHKRLMENLALSIKEREIHAALLGVKSAADQIVLQNTQILNNESFFNSQMIKLVVEQFKNKRNIPLNPETSHFINQLIVNEYREEFYGKVA